MKILYLLMVFIYFMRKLSLSYSILLLLLFFLQPGVAQKNVKYKNITAKFVNYVFHESPEKTYVQTDKDFYTNGETIWFKAYVLSGVTHKISDKSKVVYVELVDTNETVIARRKLFIGEDGANGDIVIPNEIVEGSYLLRAYTKYMMNDENPVIFQKEIPIWRQRNNSNYTSKKTFQEKEDNHVSRKKAIPLKGTRPIVQFFPEGGDLVVGIESVIGVKITDTAGNPLALKAKVFNQDGVLVSTFRSYEFGLGRASFKVEANSNYSLQIEIDGKIEKYPIPEPLLKGYTLRVMNMEDYLKIHVSTNIVSGLEGALLVGHLRGDLIFKQHLSSKDEKSFSLKLFTSKLRDGIAHFTLFAPNGEPVSERLTFVESPENNLKLSVSTNKSNFGFREKVNIDLALVDDKGKPLDGDLSMTVATQKGLQKETENLKSWLLLNSDLGGTIANPSFFFQEDVKGRKFLLDLLMLTHGWRRFTWQSFLDGGVRKELEFPLEKGIMINGATTAFNNRYQPKKAATTLSLLGEEFIQEKDSTNAQGKFSFGPFFFQDSITTILNAESLAKTKKKDEIAIHLEPPFPNIKVEHLKKPQLNKTTITYAEPYLREAQRKKLSDFQYSPKITKLKEVVVKSPKKTQQEIIDKELNSRTLYGAAQNRIFPDSIPWTQNALSILDVLRLVPGVQVFGSFPNQSVQIRGAANFSGPIDPLFLLDGMPVDNGLVQTMSVFNVLFVDVLKGADAAIYGSRAGGGVIAVYTKRGDDFRSRSKRYPGVANFSIPGFYKTREFYKPNYAITIPDHQKPDYRTTLYWEPNIKIKGGESSKLNFYTGDTSGKYVIQIEGITFDGRPVHKSYSFDIVESTQ